LLQGQILAQAGLETGRRHTLSLQCRSVTFRRELAVDLEGVDRADRAPNGVVAGEQTFLVGFHEQQLLVDKIIEDSLACFRRIQHLGIELRPHLPAQTVLLFPHRLLELLLRDLDIANPGHVVSGTRVADVGLHAEKGKWQGNQHQKNLDNLFVVANCIKHERKNPSDTFKTANGGSPKAAMIP